MDVKYQVFVSSTFIDLQDERRGVIEQILNLGHIPIGMELFQAGDETQWSYIKRRILESDYYVLIMAERYGSEGQTGKSYTQMEYEFAIKNKIPTISFLLHSDARKSWPQSKIEFDKIAKVNKFRSLCEKKLVKHWRNVDDLNTKVIGSLVELIRERPMTGWVRADSVATSLALSEMSRLLEEKRILQEKLDRYEGENTTLKIPAEIQFHINSLKSKLLAEFIETEDNNFEIPEISMMETFLILSRALSTGSTEWNIKRRLAGNWKYPA